MHIGRVATLCAILIVIVKLLTSFFSTKQQDFSAFEILLYSLHCSNSQLNNPVSPNTVVHFSFKICQISENKFVGETKTYQIFRRKCTDSGKLASKIQSSQATRWIASTLCCWLQSYLLCWPVCLQCWPTQMTSYIWSYLTLRKTG